jgi:hypothetical protein
VRGQSTKGCQWMRLCEGKRASAHPGPPGSPLPSPCGKLVSSQAIVWWAISVLEIKLYSKFNPTILVLELVAAPSHSLITRRRPTFDFSPPFYLLLVSGITSNFTLHISGSFDICPLQWCGHCLCHRAGPGPHGVNPSSLASPLTPTSFPDLSPYSTLTHIDHD